MGAQDSDRSWHELPFWTLVKNYIKSFLIGGLIIYVLTRFVNLDILILNIHIQNMWLIIPEGMIVFGAFSIWNWDRQNEKKKRQKQAKQRLQTLIGEAGGETKK